MFILTLVFQMLGNGCSDICSQAMYLYLPYCAETPPTIPRPPTPYSRSFKTIVRVGEGVYDLPMNDGQ